MNINLNRYNKDFQINDETPLEVISFLLKTSGKSIELEKISEKIEKIKKFLGDFTSLIESKEIYQLGEDLLKISCFVTDLEEEWEVENLNKAFEHLKVFRKDPLDFEMEKITLGSKSNSSPLNYDILMIYLICQNLHIKTTKEDTINSMWIKIKNNIVEKSFVIEKIRKTIHQVPVVKLKLINDIIGEKEKESCNNVLENLESLSKMININYIIGNSILTNEEAIIYAGKFLNWDISSSKFPIKALYCLKDKTDFDFADDFTKKFEINSKFFKMEKFWKPNLRFLYGIKTLASLKSYESLENLQDSLEKENWFDGVLNFDFDSQEEKNYISFGNLSSNSIQVFEVDYLVENFFKLSIFDTRLEKLLNICKEKEYKNLEKLLDRVQMTNDVVTKETINYFNSNVNKNIFVKIFDLSEILREKKIIEEIENLSIMESIKEIIGLMKSDHCKSYFYKLPLVIKKDSSYSKTKENFYSFILEDLESIETFIEKSEEYIKSKWRHYHCTSEFYLYSFFGEKLGSLQ